MSAKLLATQIAGITMGVIGTALFFNAVDKATRHDYHRRVVVFDKLHELEANSITTELSLTRPQF